MYYPKSIDIYIQRVNSELISKKEKKAAIKTGKDEKENTLQEMIWLIRMRMSNCGYLTTEIACQLNGLFTLILSPSLSLSLGQVNTRMSVNYVEICK